jgi:hypothetical protein
MWAVAGGISLFALLFVVSQSSAGRVVLPREVVIASYQCEQSEEEVARQIEFDGTLLEDSLVVQSTNSPADGRSRGTCVDQAELVTDEGQRLGCTAGPFQDEDTGITFSRRVQLVCAGSRDEVVRVIARISEIVIASPRPLRNLRR